VLTSSSEQSREDWIEIFSRSSSRLLYFNVIYFILLHTIFRRRRHSPIAIWLRYIYMACVYMTYSTTYGIAYHGVPEMHHRLFPVWPKSTLYIYTPYLYTKVGELCNARLNCAKKTTGAVWGWKRQTSSWRVSRVCVCVGVCGTEKFLDSNMQISWWNEYCDV